MWLFFVAIGYIAHTHARAHTAVQRICMLHVVAERWATHSIKLQNHCDDIMCFGNASENEFTLKNYVIISGWWKYLIVSYNKYMKRLYRFFLSFFVRLFAFLSLIYRKFFDKTTVIKSFLSLLQFHCFHFSFALHFRFTCLFLFAVEMQTNKNNMKRSLCMWFCFTQFIVNIE